MGNAPHNLDAEEAVLGAALHDNRTASRIQLRGEHFYDPVHGRLWDEIARRSLEGRLADAVALRAWANADPGMKEIGGAAYLLKLLEIGQSVLSTSMAGYADLIRELWRRRETGRACSETLSAIMDEPDPLTGLEARLQGIAQQDSDADAWEAGAVTAHEAIARAEQGEAKGLSTGFEGLDAVTGGLQPGTLWVIGGATSMGKSLIGQALGRNIASQGYGVGEIHLEMDKTQIGLRMATALAFDPDHRKNNPHYLSAQRGRLMPEQWDAMRGAAKALTHLPIYTDARPGRSLSQIEAAARRLFRKMEREGVKPGALLIDHEGLITPEVGARYPSQLERTNARSEGLLAMAKRLGVAVIALSQITKEGARADGEDRLPTLLDLNYGGAISQAASVVILIHRRAYYAERKPAHLRSEDDLVALRSRATTLVVDKARGGQRAHVEIWMDVATAAVWEAAG